MSDVDIEYQGRIPILILSPSFQYFSDITQIKQYLETDSMNISEEIIIDLSNFFRVDANLLNHLSELISAFRNRVKRFGLVIPKEIALEGLKIKLIDDFIEIYETKYEAVYDLLN